MVSCDVGTVGLLEADNSSLSVSDGGCHLKYTGAISPDGKEKRLEAHILQLLMVCILLLPKLPYTPQQTWEWLREVCVVLCSGRGHSTVPLVTRANLVFVTGKRVLKRG